MRRRVVAGFLAILLTCGVMLPENVVYAAENTEVTVEDDSETNAAETTEKESTEEKAETVTEQTESSEAISETERIEETEDEIRIGAMCTLRQIEQSEAVKKLCGDGIEEAVRHIVGVQFRNQATVGGSIYGRFGFSDVLTAFLALDTYVELYDGGRICLAEFAKKKPDNDLLLFIVVKKKKRQFRYDSIRQTKTDFPVIACSVSREKANGQETWYFAVGARPMKADLIEKKWSVAKDASLEKIEEYAALAAAEFKYGTNMRGSAGYRQHLAKVLIKREIMSILSEEI